MNWRIRHQGSPKTKALSLEQIVQGLRDGALETTDEALGPGEETWQAIENHPLLAEIAEEVEAPPPRRREEATTLDMTALIDVCLVLLIFFILTTTYAVAVQKVVPLPTLKAEGSKARVVSVKDVKERMIRMQASLDLSGKPVLRVENQTIDALNAAGDGIDTAKLKEALKPYVRGQDRKTEIILDARDISWGLVISLQDAAKEAGVHTIHHLMKRAKPPSEQ